MSKMTEHVIVTEAAALYPRHKGQFDDLLAQLPAFSEEELKKVELEQARLSKKSKKGNNGNQNRN